MPSKHLIRRPTTSIGEMNLERVVAMDSESSILEPLVATTSRLR